MRYLRILGTIIIAACYDYYIFNNGTWSNMKNTINKMHDYSEFVRSGCSIEYEPSPSMQAVVYALEITMQQDLADKIFLAEYTAQCLLSPNLLSYVLQKKEEIPMIRESVLELQQNLTENFPNMLNASIEDSRQLVPLQGSNEITSYVRQTFTKSDGDEIDEERTLMLWKDLVESPPELLAKKLNLKKYIPEPTQEPTQQPTLEFAYSYITGDNPVPSFSLSNAVLWSIQNLITKFLRDIEDKKRDISRGIQDFITDSSRLLTEFFSLPEVFAKLFVINAAALAAIGGLIKELISLRKKKSSTDLVEAEVVDDDDDDDGDDFFQGKGREVKEVSSVKYRPRTITNVSRESSNERNTGSRGRTSPGFDENFGGRRKRKTHKKGKKTHHKRKRSMRKKGRRNTRKR
jgi:hypothetical protein